MQRHNDSNGITLNPPLLSFYNTIKIHIKTWVIAHNLQDGLKWYIVLIPLVSGWTLDSTFKYVYYYYYYYYSFMQKSRNMCTMSDLCTLFPSWHFSYSFRIARKPIAQLKNVILPVCMCKVYACYVSSFLRARFVRFYNTNLVIFLVSLLPHNFFYFWSTVKNTQPTISISRLFFQ